MILWLDDIRDPAQHGFAGAMWVKNYNEAIDALKNNLFTMVSLDHDLSIDDMMGTPKGEKTGYDVLCWMEENNRWPPRGVRIHSMNPVGRQRMEQVVANHYGHLFK